MATVVLDAGHGGPDSGATFGNVREKDAALATVYTLQRLLIAGGHEVLLTRSNDVRPTFEERTRRRAADLFISVHYDCKGCRAPLYYAAATTMGRVRSESLGKRVAELIGREAKPSTDSRFGRLYIDDVTYGPALLWEVDPIDLYKNTVDYRNLRAKKFLRALSTAWKEVFRESFGSVRSA